MGYDEADVVRLARPEGKKYRWSTIPTLQLKGNLKNFLEQFIQQCQDKFLILLE
jgi:hypothetical protein